jgi:hypothetical protein
LEELAGHGEGLAEGVDKARADVALTVGRLLANEVLSSRIYCIPVVAHRLEDIIIELNGSGNEQSSVFRLRRHVGCGCR